VDHAGHFSREVAAFEATGRAAAGFGAAPAVPSCPGWVVTDLVLHLGVVHRFVARVIGQRMQEPPGGGDWRWLGLAEEWRSWLPPGHAPQRSPVPAGLLDWFHDGAADLAERFRTTAPDEQVWTWSADPSAAAPIVPVCAVRACAPAPTRRTTPAEQARRSPARSSLHRRPAGLGCRPAPPGGAGRISPGTAVPGRAGT